MQLGTAVGSKFVVPLSNWKVFEIADTGAKHLVGYDSLRHGCVSSALVSFCEDTISVETNDGRTYRLVGEPGGFWDVIDVWDDWFNSSGAVRDVTESLVVVSV